VHHHFFVGIAPMVVREATLNAAIAFAPSIGLIS
jgi:hypothetical protein